MKKFLGVGIAIITALAAHAGVPVKWTVETSRADTQEISVYHGETLDLEVQFKTYGEVLQIDTNLTAATYWQTNGMDTAYWRTNNVEILTNGVMRSKFTADMDVGAKTLRGFMGIAGNIYRASFVLRFKDAPGYAPSIVEWPYRSLDFATIEVLNAPYYTKSETYTRTEVDTQIGDHIQTKIWRDLKDGYIDGDGNVMEVWRTSWTNSTEDIYKLVPVGLKLAQSGVETWSLTTNGIAYTITASGTDKTALTWTLRRSGYSPFSGSAITAAYDAQTLTFGSGNRSATFHRVTNATITTNKVDELAYESDLSGAGGGVNTNAVRELIAEATNALVVAPHEYEGRTGYAADAGAYAEAWSTNAIIVGGTNFVYTISDSTLARSIEAKFDRKGKLKKLKVFYYENPYGGEGEVEYTESGSYHIANTEEYESGEEVEIAEYPYNGIIIKIWSESGSDDLELTEVGGGIFNPLMGTTTEANQKQPYTETALDYANTTAARAYADAKGREIAATYAPTSAAVVAATTAATVAYWENYWTGDKVRLSVTNYYGNTSGELPRLRIEEFDHSTTTTVEGVDYVTNVFRVVWDEENRHTNYQATVDTRVGQISNTVLTAAWRQTVNQLAAKAPKAWQSVTSAGEDAPANTVWHTAPNTVFAGGTEYAHVAVGEGTICVLTENGAAAYTDGEEGTFRFRDDSGKNYFGFDVRSNYTLGCRTDGISVDSDTHMVSLTYDLTSEDNPDILTCTNLLTGTWSEVSVTWEENPPANTKVCYIDVGSSPQGFYKAQMSYAGGSKFVTNMQADLAGGIAASNETLNVVQSIYPAITNGVIIWRIKQ